MHLALGLMSGTSADGVSAALGSFHDRSFKLLGHINVDYPDGVAQRIQRGADLKAPEISELNMELGELFAHAANKLIKKLHVDPKKIECIGSHGQTIYHGPRDKTPNTLQIADPSVIAERTGITVVSNFRERDIAVGGEGAPLIPYFDQFFYGQGPLRAFQNIGGISNVTIVGKGVKDPLAFDTGPGNCLMDMAVQIMTSGQENFDRNGQYAKRGKIDMTVIGPLMENDYFKKAPPKSTGRELFNEKFLREHLGPLLASNPIDAIATLMYYTCLTIQESYRAHVFGKYSISDIVVSGGGVHNKTLMKKLECLFAPIPVVSIESLGLPSQAKEPLAFAFFGLRCLHNQPNHLPTGTGAKRSVILGRITRS